MLTSQQLSRAELRAFDRTVTHLQKTVDTLQETLPLDDVDVTGALDDFEHAMQKLYSFYIRQSQQ